MDDGAFIRLVLRGDDDIDALFAKSSVETGDEPVAAIHECVGGQRRRQLD